MNRESKIKRVAWLAQHYKYRLDLIFRLLKEVPKEGGYVGAEVGIWKADFVFELLRKGTL